VSAEDRTVSDGGRDASDPCAIERETALAWIAAAEAWLTCSPPPYSSRPNYTRAVEALSRAWWHAAEARAISEGISRGEAVHGFNTQEETLNELING
jgi:hypothetical protein